ncbi:phage terminase small subunit P27 family [Hyphomonas sp.]|uniref:phage terminase small subunit P27 family n=1 Tax=Hyphomonas sp. TaxID=87 RepID=UPI0025C03674|nr:phage terminase small subunit P27 family [Hyphomonas sp.]
MARGRKPDAPGLQAAKGNPGKRKAKKSSPPQLQPIVVEGVKPPKWLKKSRAATEVWNTLAPLLRQLNALTQLDAFPLARYCRYVVDWIAADEAVRKEGTWYDTKSTTGEETKKRHPAFHARQDLDKTLREIEGAFGMRPDMRFKMLRDQSLATGLPLFGNNLPAGGESAPPRSEGEPVDQAPEDEDMIGVLNRMDSAGPDTLPN